MASDVPKRLYFPHVEGLRGLAAVYVFLFHLRSTTPAGEAFAKIFALTPFLAYGHYAVAVFIVISGYCLGAPIAFRPESTFDLKQFVLRRFRRIYPAYFAALTMSTVAFFYWAPHAFSHVAPLRNVVVAFAAHALMVHNLIQITALYFNVPMWSVGVEMQIYAIFALILVPLWKRFGALAQLVVALSLGMLPHYAFHGELDWTCPWFLGLFSMGVFAASLSAKQLANVTWRIGASVAIIAAILFSTRWSVMSNAEGYGPFILSDNLVGAAVSVFLVASVDAKGRCWGPARFLALTPIAWLGTFAYSTYLLHWILIVVLREALLRMNASQALSVAAYVLLIPAVLLISYVFFLIFERPFMSQFLEEQVRSTNPSDPVSAM